MQIGREREVIKTPQTTTSLFFYNNDHDSKSACFGLGSSGSEELKITVNNDRGCLKWYLLLNFSPTRIMFSCGNKAGAFGLTNKGYKLNIGENYLYVIFIVGI